MATRTNKINKMPPKGRPRSINRENTDLDQARAEALRNQDEPAIHQHNSPQNQRARPAARLANNEDAQQQYIINIAPPRPFEYEPDSQENYGLKWNNWMRRFDNWMISSGIIANDARKIAILISTAGEKIDEVHQTNRAENETYEGVKTMLEEYFNPRKDTLFETLQFRQISQRNNEPIDEFVQRLRLKAQNCEFGDRLDTGLFLQITAGCKSTSLRSKAIRGTGNANPLTLEDLIRYARAQEASSLQVKAIEETNASTNFKSREDVNSVGQHTNPNAWTNPKTNPLEKRPANTSNQGGAHPWGNKHKQQSDKGKENNPKCHNCGYEHANRACPARGMTCNNCNKPNHFASVCRSSRPPRENQRKQRNFQTKPHRPRYNTVNQLKTTSPATSTSEFDQTFSVQATRVKINDLPHASVSLNGTKVLFCIDTGSTVTTIDHDTYQKLMPKPELIKTNSEVFGYPSNLLEIEGSFTSPITCGARQIVGEILVIKGQAQSLLSYFHSKALELIRLPDTIMNTTDHIEKNASTTAAWTTSNNQLKTMYPEVFSDKLGKLKNVKIKLDIDSSVRPVRQKQRHTPYHIRGKVGEKLIKMEREGVLRRVKGPTPWVSNIVPVLKGNGEYRICADNRQANEAILNTKHPMPMPEDLNMELNGAQVFSKIDIKDSFHQIELDEESKYITVLSTHLGLFEYERLNMGICSATEIFQNTLEQQLANLTKTKNMIDDIIVWGTDQRDHDKNLHALLKRLEQIGLTANLDKCEFSKSRINFYGLEFSKDGVRAQKCKIAALKNAAEPRNAKEVRSFMGLAQFCSKHIPNLATIARPLRLLTRKNNRWQWGPIESQAFNDVKQAIIEQAMSYFDPTWNTHLTVDASPTGLGSILWQSKPNEPSTIKLIKLASKALNDVEIKYSQCEKEGYAAVWGCEDSAIYLIGSRFELITDNKGIENIFKNPSSKPPARIQRWHLRLSQFNFKITHRPGISNISDYLSRNPCDKPDHKYSAPTERFVQSVITQCIPNALRAEEIAEATEADPTLNKLKEIVKGKPHNPNDTELAPYLKVLKDISMSGDEKHLLKLDKLIIPEALQARVIKLGHEGHQGIIKTKKLIRSKVWFPGIDAQTEQAILNCPECRLSSKPNYTEPLSMTKMPNAWEVVAIDHKGPLPNGNMAVVLYDLGTRYPIVKEVKSTSFENNEHVLEDAWSTFGAPREVLSDNGPPFSGEKLKLHLKSFGIKHRKVMPGWPRANGAAEVFMKNISKVIKTAETNKKPFTKELNTFLIAYRSTPHSSTGIAPATLMFNREVNTSRLPSTFTRPSNTYVEAQVQDQLSKERMKHYSDTKSKARYSNIKVGDQVMLDTKRDRKLSNKSQTRFGPEVFTVIRKNGSMVTAVCGNKKITRNVAFFKHKN